MTKRNETTGGEVLITRIFDAPRKMVFKAWTDPKHMERWYAPQGCTITFINHDLRAGASFISHLKNPAHHDCLCKNTYLEVVAPERLVFTMSFTDEQGNFVDPVQAGADADWPAETTVTVTFEELDGKTKVTLHQTVAESIAKRTGAYPSWLQMLDKLAQELVPA